MNPQPTAAPITPEEIAALRDALAKATQGDLAPKLLAALDAAEAKAVEFAWELFNRNTEFVYVVTSALPRLRALTLASESAAEYLAARGLLRKTGERTWQRVDRKEGGSK